jgi:hypothetical protein
MALKLPGSVDYEAGLTDEEEFMVGNGLNEGRPEPEVEDPALAGRRARFEAARKEEIAAIQAQITESTARYSAEAEAFEKVAIEIKMDEALKRSTLEQINFSSRAVLETLDTQIAGYEDLDFDRIMDGTDTPEEVISMFQDEGSDAASSIAELDRNNLQLMNASLDESGVGYKMADIIDGKVASKAPSETPEPAAEAEIEDAEVISETPPEHSDAPSVASQISALDAVKSLSMEAPEDNPEFFATPNAAAISPDEDAAILANMGEIDSEGAVRKGPSVEELMTRQEAYLAAEQEQDPHDWMNKPDPWPAMIVFPSKRDMARINDADARGELTDDLKNAFNEEFQNQSDLMQQRAAQMHMWIIEQTIPVVQNLKGVQKVVDLQSKHEMRVQAEIERIKEDPEATQDPFFGVKWATLIDPTNKMTGTANVARWGHDRCVMQDGGHIQANDDGMFVPKPMKPTAMAGRFMVEEAVQRGWDTIVIDGEPEFVEAARKAAIEYGIGAQITTRYGLIGKSKTEFIMPKVPGLEANPDLANAKSGDVEAVAERLLGEEGKAPKAQPKTDRQPVEDPLADPAPEPEEEYEKEISPPTSGM